MKKNNWFFFANEDLIMSENALENKVYNQVCFHAQQGVEKVLKGFLYAKEKFVPPIHLLQELLSRCKRIDKDFLQIEEDCLQLDKYYIPTRYPDALPGILPEGLPKEKDAREALEVLKRVIKFVKKKIK